MHLSTLSSWLDWIGSVHNTEIELGLDRIREVALQLDLLNPQCKVIVVGGTNGKGSVVAGLEAVYLAAGYRVGAFTSPYLIKHNEEVRVNGKEASDDDFCWAFSKIESKRGSIPLTPFEYHTLAALLIFDEANLDVMILEVGLGGRLDAVNIIDADVSIITSIGIDHVDWLGDTRELIAIEKAGIMRSEKPVICGDTQPPQTLIDAAITCGAHFFQQGQDFSFLETAQGWDWHYAQNTYRDLPNNPLLKQNMSSVLMAVTTLQSVLPVPEVVIRKAMAQVKVRGRLQVIQGKVTEIFDVSHNPASAAILAKFLKSSPCPGKTLAVFSMLADKDIVSTVDEIKNEISSWYVAPLTCKRAALRQQLATALQGLDVHFFESIPVAYQQAQKEARPQDRIVVFGSFYTVGAVLPDKHTEP